MYPDLLDPLSTISRVDYTEAVLRGFFMTATECLERIPTSDEIRQRIAQTYQEARALKALLRAAEQREKLATRQPKPREGHR